MQVAVSQREIWNFMKMYADRLANTLQPQNCVPNSVLNPNISRLNDFAKLFDYATAQAERPSYRNMEKRDVAIDLTQDEVYVLMRAAAKELLHGLEEYPYRTNTGKAMARLNELQAVMPPYKEPDNSEG